MRFDGAGARLFLKALGASLVVAAGLLILAASAPALTPEETHRENERFKALSEENQRLLDGVFHPKSHQVKSTYAKKSRLRKLRKADANLQEMRHINKRLQDDSQKIGSPPEVERKLRDLHISLGQIEKAKGESVESRDLNDKVKRESAKIRGQIAKVERQSLKSQGLIEKAKREMFNTYALIDQSLREQQKFIKTLINLANKNVTVKKKGR